MEERLGRYELRRAIGRGAAGTVYEAWDSTLARRVAVKVVRLSGQEGPRIDEFLARFRQEAQVASRLSHPGVVSVYDYGETEGETGGLAFIVMEFITGETLKTVLDRDTRLTPPRAAGIMREVLLALDYCHRNAIVHRDIKPSNIMLPAGGGVKLADFGIARIENSELTLLGTVMGTPPYMSPEQYMAERRVDFRSDIWSAGVVLYEMLTGVRPFTGSTMTAIRQGVTGQPVEPPSRRVSGLPAALDPVLLRALNKVPEVRFASAGAFAEALAAAVPAAAGGGPPRPGRRRGGLLVGGIAGVAALAAGAAGWLWLATSPPQTQTIQTQTGPTQTGPTQTGQPQVPQPQVVPPVPALPIPEQLAALPCSAVSLAPGGGASLGGVRLRGVIGAGAPRATLDALIARWPAPPVQDAVQTFPQTPLACRLAELVRTNPGTGAMRLASPGGRVALVQSDEIRLRLRMPDFDGEVRLEDLNGEGQVVHLMEANLGAPRHHWAGEELGLGRDGDDLIGHVSPPYGTDLLVAIVSSEPLFAGRRPALEAGEPFMAALSAAIDDLHHRGGHLAMDALVLTTSRR